MKELEITIPNNFRQVFPPSLGSGVNIKKVVHFLPRSFPHFARGQLIPDLQLAPTCAQTWTRHTLLTYVSTTQAGNVACDVIIQGGRILLVREGAH